MLQSGEWRCHRQFVFALMIKNIDVLLAQKYDIILKRCITRPNIFANAIKMIVLGVWILP